MNPLLRFWLMMVGLMVSLVSLGYLFFSFISPEAELVATAPEVRIVITLVGVIAAALFVWAALIAPDQTLDFPRQQER